MRTLNLVIVTLVIGGAFYLAVILGMPIFNQRAFMADVRDMSRMTIITDTQEFKHRVLEKANEYALSITAKDVKVGGVPGAYRVKVAWTETVYVFSKEYNFVVEVPQ